MIRWDRRSCIWVRRVWSDGTGKKWLDGTGEVVYGSGEFNRMGQEKMIWWDRRSWYYIKTRRFFWQQMSYFYSWEDDCYQNCKVILTKNLRWNYHLAMDEKWPTYQSMAAQYWMSHQYHHAFYFRWWCNIAVTFGQDGATCLPLSPHWLGSGVRPNPLKLKGPRSYPGIGMRSIKKHSIMYKLQLLKM